MVVANGRDDGEEGSGDDVGRVESAAQPGFPGDIADLLFPKVEQRQASDVLEKGERDLVLVGEVKQEGELLLDEGAFDRIVVDLKLYLW